MIACSVITVVIVLRWPTLSLAPQPHRCFGGALDQILGGAANTAGAALHGIGPGSFWPARHTAANTVTELKQGSTQPAGHSFEATASMCWLSIDAVVPNDTKGVWRLLRCSKSLS